jgi:hypothetical protein
VRDRSCDIVSIEPPIERNRFATALRDFRGGFAKSSRSHRQFGSLNACGACYGRGDVLRVLEGEFSQLYRDFLDAEMLQ